MGNGLLTKARLDHDEPAFDFWLPNIPLYHWSPSTNYARINRRGLKPRMRPCIHDGDGIETWRADWVCFGATPDNAWHISGAVDWAPEGEWDLWMAWSEDIGPNAEVITSDEGWWYDIHEVRVFERVLKRHLWYVGSRWKEDG